MTCDVAVVGSGIVGAACADALSRDGHRVVVIEAAIPGGGATAAGMGHIVAMDDSEAQFALCRYSQSLWDALAAELPREVEFERRGTLWVAAGEEFAAVRAKHAWYRARGVATHILDCAAMAEAEPELRGGLAGGLLAPADSVIYAPCAARWLLDRAVSLGTILVSGDAVRVDGTRVDLRDGGKVDAGTIVVACGTAAVRLAPEIPVRPRKGHLAITDRYPGFVRHQLVELGYLTSAHAHEAESVAFNIQPRSTGQVLIGSSRQYDVESPEVEPRMLRRMLLRAITYMPRVAELAVIRTWTGFRAATPDGLPLIGPREPGARVWLAAGHEGLGITTSLGTAALVADGIAGRASAIAAGPYLPERFS
jgi:glycine/D-amino acid oxidase-like deaminating enzyme